MTIRIEKLETGYTVTFRKWHSVIAFLSQLEWEFYSGLVLVTITDTDTVHAFTGTLRNTWNAIRFFDTKLRYTGNLTPADMGWKSTPKQK